MKKLKGIIECVKFYKKLLLLSVLLDNMERCPADIAKTQFYQFVKSPMGLDLWKMLSLNGPLNPDDWDIYHRWWLEEKQKMQDKLLRRGDCSEWPMFIVWRSQLFMHVLLEIQRNMVTNITAIPLEKLIWDFTTLRNILLEMKLVSEVDLVKKLPKPTHFQKIAVMGKFMILDRLF